MWPFDEHFKEQDPPGQVSQTTWASNPPGNKGAGEARTLWTEEGGSLANTFLRQKLQDLVKKRLGE